MKAISTRDAQEILLSTGEWAGIVMMAENVQAPAMLRGLCINVRDTVRQSAVIRMDNPAIRARTEAALGALVDAALLSPETRDALLALADQDEGGDPAMVDLPKGYPVPGGLYVVLSAGQYSLDQLVECATVARPDSSICSFSAAYIVGVGQ